MVSGLVSSHSSVGVRRDPGAKKACPKRTGFSATDLSITDCVPENHHPRHDRGMRLTVKATTGLRPLELSLIVAVANRRGGRVPSAHAVPVHEG